MSAANPISPKMIAGAIGAGGGAAISSALLWLLGAAAFGGGWSSDRVDNAIAAVPSPLAALVLLVVTVATSAVASYATTDPLRVPTLDVDKNRALEAARARFSTGGEVNSEPVG